MMVFISLIEIFDITVMAGLIGFLFMDLLPDRNKSEWEKFKLAVISLSPAIILHELAHKFVAMAFGLDAVFKAFYHSSTTLFLGVLAIIAKLSNFGLIFLVPGYVQICGGGNNSCNLALATHPLWGAMIAFAGPLIHLIFWLVSAYILKNKAKKLSNNWYAFFVLNKKINMFLFILNMLPIPGIDGFSVYYHLWQAF